jgi:hypothetical protein
VFANLVLRRQLGSTVTSCPFHSYQLDEEGGGGTPFLKTKQWHCVMTVEYTLELFRTIFTKVLIISFLAFLNRSNERKEGVKFDVFTAVKTVIAAHPLEYGGSRFLRNDGNHIRNYSDSPASERQEEEQKRQSEANWVANINDQPIPLLETTKPIWRWFKHLMSCCLSSPYMRENIVTPALEAEFVLSVGSISVHIDSIQPHLT